MKDTQDELFQYSEAVSKASQFNNRLRELIAIRDAFDPADVSSLERLLPSKIDQMEVMRAIEAIFESRNIPIASLTAEDEVSPVTDIAVESPVIVKQENGELSYQDFKVVFSGSYANLRDILALTEMSASLLEVVELDFGSGVNSQTDVDDEGASPIVAQQGNDQHQFSLTFRSYGLPVTSI